MCSISTNLLFIGANFATYAYAIVKKSTMQVKEKDAFMLFCFYSLVITYFQNVCCRNCILGRICLGHSHNSSNFTAEEWH